MCESFAFFVDDMGFFADSDFGFRYFELTFFFGFLTVLPDSCLVLSNNSLDGCAFFSMANSLAKSSSKSLSILVSWCSKTVFAASRSASDGFSFCILFGDVLEVNKS